MVDIGEWFRRDRYDIHKMIKAMKKEPIEYLKPIDVERERFIWRESLVMVKKTGRVHINNMTDDKREFIKQFKKRQKKQKQLTFNNSE